MSSSAALWRCVVAHAPWSASSTSRAWTALSMPSSMATTNGTSGGTGPSAFLHKQLDITATGVRLTPRLGFVRLGAVKLSIGFLPFTRELRGGLALVAILLTASSCAVRRTTRVPAAQAPPPTLEASTADLVGRINAQSAAVRTLNLTVDLAPTAGSVYSGVIKEYRDVRAFILVAKPAMIRIID